MSLVGRGTVSGQPNKLEEGQDSNTGKDFLSAANYSGPLYDQNNNRLQQSNHIEQLKRFFGVPRRELPQDPYSNYSVENDTLPDAYTGHNGYMTQILISKIENTEQWPITKMLPLLRHQGSVQFSWDQLIFNDELMRRVPEESVPHLVTHKHERHSTNMLRYGIALRLEHGFYKTAIGQQTYAMNLRQIANAIIETSCYAAVTTVVNEAPYEDANDAFRDDSANNIINIESRFQEELAQFGALQKQDGGLDMIVSRAEKVLSDRGVNGTFWIFPQGTKAYAQGTPAEKLFWLSGRRSGEERDVIRDTIGSTTFVESRGFRLGENEFNHDPLFREQTIGTYFQMHGRGLMDVPPESFRTNMLDVEVYNENCDAFTRLSYMELFQYTGLFQNFDSEEYFYPLTHLGTLFFGKFRTWKDYLDIADPHGYFYATFGKLSSEKKRDFARTVISPMIADYGKNAVVVPTSTGIANTGTTATTNTGLYPNISQPVNANINQPLNPNQNDSSIIMTPGPTPQTQGQSVPMDTGTGAMMTTKDWKSGLLKTIGTSLWNDITKESASKFTEFIHNIQENFQDTRIMQLYQAFVEQNQNNTSLSFETFSWKTLGAALLDIDKKASVQKVFKADLTPTSFESVFMKQDSVLKDNDNGAVDIILNNLRNADENSPQWVPLKGKMTPITLPVTPSGSHSSKLEFKSFALSLTSTHLVLFQIDDNVIDAMSKNGGTIEIENTKSSSLNEIRYALLQYSIAISVVYSTLMANKKESSSDMTKILTQLKQLISLNDSVTGTKQTLKEAIEYVDEQKFGTLFSQFWASAIIQSIHSLLKKYITSTLTEQQWVQHIGDIMNTLNSNSSASELLKNFKQSLTGAHMSAGGSTDVYGIEQHLIQTHSLDANSINALMANGQKHVSDLHKTLVPNATQRDTINDPYLYLADDFVRMYALIHILPSSTVPDEDKSKIFKNAVKRVFAVTQSKDLEYNPSILAKKFIEIILTQLKAGQLQSKFSDGNNSREYLTVVPFKNEDTALYIPFLKQELQNESSSAYASLKYIPYYQIQNWNTYLKTRLHGKDQRKNVDLNEQVRLMRLRFSLGTDKPFVYAMTIFENVEFEPMAVKNALNQFDLSSDSRNDTLSELSALIQKSGISISPRFQQYLDPSNTGSASSDFLSRNTNMQLFRKTTTEVNVNDIESTVSKLKIDGALVKWCLKNNVYVPIQLICFRPHMRYVQGSAVFMEGGSSTGNTLYANPDMQMADNVAQKIHVAHYTQNLKAVVYDKKKIVVMRNVLTSKYLGGYGVSPWDPLNEEHVDNYKSNELTCDMFVVPEMPNFRFAGNVADISGSFNGKVAADSSANMSTKYTLSKALSALWGWKNTAPLNNLSYRPVASGSKFNTIVFQDYCAQYNYGDKKYSDIIPNHGHFSTQGACAPGAGKVRKGQQKYYQVATPWMQIRA